MIYAMGAGNVTKIGHMSPQFEHAYVKTNGITLHVVQAGPQNGPLVILLHGFPEFWYGWRHQIPFLAKAGFRVWSPDQRGYNLSDKPPEISAYNLDQLAADVMGLIEAADHEQVYLIGHDWGGAVAWWVANKYPEQLDKLIILNAPHHRVMNYYVRHNLSQLGRSSYILFFQIPWLPEVVSSAANWYALVQSLRQSSRPGAFTPADITFYRQAWSRPGAFTAMLNWYRAIRQSRPRSLSSPRIKVPTLMIWGAQDIALSREMAQASIELCDDGRLFLIEEATHWVQHEEPNRVNNLLLEFVT
jgi:pimeloyl-ACP methyl ester carboxylesterase